VLQCARFVLSEDDDLPGPFCEAFEQFSGSHSLVEDRVIVPQGVPHKESADRDDP
jgi:hypothetical protein